MDNSGASATGTGCPSARQSTPLASMFPIFVVDQVGNGFLAGAEHAVGTPTMCAMMIGKTTFRRLSFGSTTTLLILFAFVHDMLSFSPSW